MKFLSSNTFLIIEDKQLQRINSADVQIRVRRIFTENVRLVAHAGTRRREAPASGEKLGPDAAYGDSYRFETTETLPVGYALIFDAPICVTNQRLFPRAFYSNIVLLGRI
jgi:hypothetical protein